MYGQYLTPNAHVHQINKTTYCCQSNAGVSINALNLVSSSNFSLAGAGSGHRLLELEWTAGGSGIEYKSFPNSSNSSSACNVVD